MGRPREHGADTRAALLRVAGELLAGEGVEALALRRVADEAGTTTRAVYSLFGSKEGLIVALGARTFEMLRAGLDDVSVTADPRGDLLEAALMFRRFALDHPVLFAIGIQRIGTSPAAWERFRPGAADALTLLTDRFARLEDPGLLRGRSAPRAAGQFHALCEGLAALELRGALGDPEAFWREAVSALVAGLAGAPQARQSRG
jgi:AcrR family transcriptional regulator